MFSVLLAIILGQGCASDEGDCADCDAAQARVVEVQQDNLTCEVTKDCLLLYYDVGCLAGCQIAVSVDGAEVLQQAMDAEQEGFCGGEETNQDCAKMQPACDKGTCTQIDF